MQVEQALDLEPEALQPPLAPLPKPKSAAASPRPSPVQTARSPTAGPRTMATTSFDDDPERQRVRGPAAGALCTSHWTRQCCEAKR